MVTGGLHLRGKIWYAVWNVDGKQVWRSTRTRNKAEAKLKLAEFVAPFQHEHRGRELLEAAAREYKAQGEAIGAILRINNIWTCYVNAPERPDSGPITLNDYKRQLSRLTAWITEKYPKKTNISDITKIVASEYCSMLGKSVGASTFNRYITAYRLIWKIIGKRTGWKNNPWEDIARKFPMKRSKRDLTWDEIKRLVECSKGEYRTLIVIGIYTALRLADATTLKWEEIKWDENCILRMPRKTSRRAHKIVRIPLFPELKKQLLMAHDLSKDDEYVCPSIARAYLSDRTRVGKPILRLFNSAGIETTENEKQDPNRTRKACTAGFHSLRHSFVSLCRAGDVPEAVVMSIVGHGSPAMTRHYTHVGNDATEAAIYSLPGLDQGLYKSDADHVPGWIQLELSKMNDGNWKEVRDCILAKPVEANRHKPITDTNASMRKQRQLRK